MTPPREPGAPGVPRESGEPRAFPYRLIATDLDGTLLRGDETVSPRTRAALAAAAAAGGAHLVATGRTVAWTRHILDDLGYRGLAVCGQGAQLYHAGEDRLLTTVTLDRALARQALALLEAELGPLGVAASRDGLAGDVLMDEVFWEHAARGWRAEVAEEAEGGERRARPLRAADRAALWSEPLIKLYLLHPDHSDDGLAAAARAVLGASAQIVIAGPRLVELLPAGLSKATGLSLAARRLGVTAAQTIAFGDMPNDIPMLRWSAHGVAMAGAHPEVLAVADEVTAGNEEDGIAAVLEPLLQG